VLLHWLQTLDRSAHKDDTVTLLLAAETAEKFLFTQAVAHLEFGDAAKEPQPCSEAQAVEDIEALRSVAMLHLALHKRTVSKAKPRMLVERFSKDTLVQWVVYSLIHRRCRQLFAIMGEFGVALQFGDLEHMVLGDKLSRDAALSTAAYLRLHTKSGKELFSTSHAHIMEVFANRYAITTPSGSHARLPRTALMVLLPACLPLLESVCC